MSSILQASLTMLHYNIPTQNAQQQVKHNPLGNGFCMNQLGSQQMPHVFNDQLGDTFKGFLMMYGTEIKGERSLSW